MIGFVGGVVECDPKMYSGKVVAGTENVHFDVKDIVLKGLGVSLEMLAPGFYANGETDPPTPASERRSVASS